MFDHNERQPEENTNPKLIQDLQTIYQLKPEERHVLMNVHERLAHSIGHLPISEQAQNNAFKPVLLQPTSIDAPARPVAVRRTWTQTLNVIAAVIVCGLLISTMVLIFATVHHTPASTKVSSPGLQQPATANVLLLPTDSKMEPSKVALKSAVNTLAQRFDISGIKTFDTGVRTIKGRSGIQMVVLRPNGNEQQTIKTLTQAGKVEFWGTGTNILASGTQFDPRRYTQYNAGHYPQFTGADINPTSLSVTLDSSTGKFIVNFAMKSGPDQRFREYTRTHTGQALTITLDSKVIMSAIIQTTTAGKGQIRNNFTKQQAQDLVAMLKTGPLPLNFKQVN